MNEPSSRRWRDNQPERRASQARAADRNFTPPPLRLPSSLPPTPARCQPRGIGRRGRRRRERGSGGGRGGPRRAARIAARSSACVATTTSGSRRRSGTSCSTSSRTTSGSATSASSSSAGIEAAGGHLHRPKAPPTNSTGPEESKCRSSATRRGAIGIGDGRRRRVCDGAAAPRRGASHHGCPNRPRCGRHVTPEERLVEVAL
jgi:hypothetical protein